MKQDENQEQGNCSLFQATAMKPSAIGCATILRSTRSNVATVAVTFYAEVFERFTVDRRPGVPGSTRS